MKKISKFAGLTFLSLFGASVSAHAEGSCGGFNSAFPSSAGKDYANTCWAAIVNKDELTDKISCNIYPAGMHNAPYPFISINKKSIYMSVSGVDRYPRSPIAVRVDEKKAIQGGESFGKPAIDSFLKQLVGASFIKVRLTDWPYDTYVDGKWDADGLLEAISYCREKVK